MIGKLKLPTDRRLWLVGVLITALFFSYQPVLSIGKLEGINLEFSVAQLMAIVVIVTQSRVIWRMRSALMKNIGVRLLFLYCVFVSLSVLWADAKPRALVIAAYTWFLFALFTTVISLVSHTNLKRCVPVVWVITIVMSLFGWWQVFGDALGASPVLTFLRPEYRSQVFGFARPQGFALEPEFFASLLLAPVVYGIWLELKGEHTKLSRLAWILGLSILVATISRGALLALGAALIVLLCVNASWKRKLVIGGAGIAVAAVSIMGLTSAAALNGRDAISGEMAFVRTINQLTLGVAKLSVPSPTKASDNKEPEGYVASSTTSRLSMSKAAVDIWLARPDNLLFGVGVSNFATSLRQHYHRYPEASIVNNQYLEVLVETGVTGFLLFIGTLVVPVLIYTRRRQLLPVALLTALYVQWCFFSGNANIIHVWVVLALFYGVVNKTLKSA